MRYFKLSDGRTVTCRDAQAVSTLIKWGRDNNVGLSEVYWYKTPDGKDWTVDAWAKNNGALDNPKLKGAMDMGAKEAHDHPFVRGDQATIQARKPGEAGLTPSHEKTFIEKAWDVVKHPLKAGIRTALGPVGSVVDLYAGAAKLVSGNDKNKANPIYQDPEPPRWVQEPLNRRNEAVTNLENLSVSRPPAEAPELESAWKQQYDSTLAEAEKQEEIYLFRATGLTEAQREYKEETATWAKKHPLLATLSQLPTGFEALYKAPANVMAAGGAIDTGKGWWYAKRQGLAEGLAEAGKGWSDWGSALYSFGLTMPSYVATLSIALSGGATAPFAGPLIIAAASARELSSMSDNLRDSYFNDGVLSTNELWAGATNAFIEEGIETIGLNLQAGTFANAYKLGGTAGMQKAIATQLGKKAMPGLAQGGLTFMTMYGEELGEEILTNVGQMVVNNVMLGTPLPTREELQQQFRDTAVQTLYGTILQGGVSVGYTVMQSQSQMRKLTALSDETLSWSSPKMALDAINQLKAFDIEGAKATAMKAQETLIKDDAAMDDKAKKVVAQAIGNVLDASLKYDMQTAEGVYVEQKAVQKTLDRLEAEQKQLEQDKPSPERDQRLFDIGEQIEELQRESIRIDGLITENAQQKEIYNLLVEGIQAEQKARKAGDKAVDKLVKTKEYKEATPEQQRQMMKDAVLSDKKSAKLQEKADQKYRDADLYKLRQTSEYKQAAPEVQTQMEEAELQRQQEARDAEFEAARQKAISEQQEAEKTSQTQPTEATEDNEIVPDIIDQLEAKKAAIRQERQDINKELNEYRKLMDQQGGWLPSVTPEQKKAYHEVKKRQKEVNRKLNEVGIEIRKEKAARKKAEREAQNPIKQPKKSKKAEAKETETKEQEKPEPKKEAPQKEKEPEPVPKEEAEPKSQTVKVYRTSDGTKRVTSKNDGGSVAGSLERLPNGKYKFVPDENMRRNNPTALMLLLRDTYEDIINASATADSALEFTKDAIYEQQGDDFVLVEKGKMGFGISQPTEQSTRTKSEALQETLPTIPDKTADDALLGMVKSHILSITRKDRTTTVNFKDGRKLVINHITQEAMLTEAGRTGVMYAGRTQGEKGKNVYTAIVDLVDGLNQGNRTLFHESFHVVWKLFLNSEQISYINQYYRAKANKGELVRKYVVTRQGTEMALYWTKEQFNALNRERQAEALEEGAAYGFEHWLGSRTDTAPTTMIGKLWQRLADAIRHALVKLNLANQNAKLTDIFHAIASDKLTGQGEQGAEATEQARYKPVPTAAEAERQYAEVEAKYRGTDAWLKAPNGKPTNLNERQWVQVRTQAFKDWFGDWENDPANASKVVDENGEPLVMWHGGSFNQDIDGVFEVPVGGVHFGTKYAAEAKINANPADDMLRSATVEYDDDMGAWFWETSGYSSDDMNPDGFETEREARADLEDTVSQIEIEPSDDDVITEVFLNIRNIRGVPDQADDWADTVQHYKDNTSIDGLSYINQFEDKGSRSYIIFKGTQIKSATANVGTFDQSNPDIRYKALSKEDVSNLSAYTVQKFSEEIPYATVSLSKSDTRVGRSHYIKFSISNGIKFMRGEIRISDHGVGTYRHFEYIHAWSESDIDEIIDSIKAKTAEIINRETTVTDRWSHTKSGKTVNIDDFDQIVERSDGDYTARRKRDNAIMRLRKGEQTVYTDTMTRYKLLPEDSENPDIRYRAVSTAAGDTGDENRNIESPRNTLPKGLPLPDDWWNEHIVKRANERMFLVEKEAESYGAQAYVYELRSPDSDRARAKTTYRDYDEEKINPIKTRYDKNIIGFDGEIIDDRYQWLQDNKHLNSQTPNRTAMWRGVSAPEMASIINTGKVESLGDMNFDSQQGRTSASQSPSQAVSYASSFAAWYDKPTFDAPAYVLEMSRPGNAEINRVNEIEIVGATPVTSIEKIYEIRVAEEIPGKTRINHEKYGRERLYVSLQSPPLQKYVVRELAKSEWQDIDTAIRYRKLTERERAMRDDVWNEIMGRKPVPRVQTRPMVQTEPPERGQERKTEPPRPQPTRPSQSNPPTEAEIDVLSERIGKDLGIASAQVKEKLGRQMMAAWREAQGDVSRLMESAAIRNFEEWVENNKPEGTDKKDLVWHWEEMLEYAAKVGLSREQIAQMVKSDRFDATAIGINLFQRMNYIGKLLVETEATLSDRNWGTPAEREQMEAQYGILQAQFDELQAAYAMQGSEAGTVLWTRRQNKAQYLENLTRAAQALESKINRGAVELGEMRQELDGLERTISDLEKSFEMLLRVMDGKRYKDITEMNDAELEAERQKQAEQLNDMRNRAEHLKYAIEQKVAAMQADKGRQVETQTQIRKIRKIGRKPKVIEIKVRKPDVHDWIRAAWYNSVLAGLPTHMVNMSANVVNSLLEDVATLFTQGGRVAGAQFAEKVRALFSNYEQLDPKTGEKIKAGAFAKAKEEFTSPQEFSKKNEVILKGNKFFMGIQFSTKFLGAEDMLAFFPNERGMLKSLAFDESKRTGRSVADLMENPTADMLRQAYYEAKRNTFNQNPEQYVGVLIDTINKFYGALDQSGGGGKAIGNLIRFNVLPFTRVLGNVLNATIDYTPLGMIRYFAYKSDNPNSLLNRQRKDQNGRPLWLDENGDPMVSPFRMRDARRQAARVALGTILGSLLYFLAMSADDDDDDKWFISGAGPQDYKKYKQLMAAGWRPYSIHIGNAIISYKEWPVSGAFAVVGNLHDIQKYDGKTRPQDWMDKTIYATMGVASSFLDRSFASNAISTATAFDRNDPKWVKRSLTSTTSSTIIPYNNMLRFIENTYNRNLYTPETIAQQAWASVPLVPKKGLPRRVNVFGMYERKDPATARLAMTDNVGLVVPDTQNTRKIFQTVRKNNLFLSETTKRELRVDPYVGKRGIPEEDKQHIWLRGKDHENFRVMRGTEYVRLLNESENYNLIMKYDKDKDKDEMAALLTSLGRKATAYATEETLKAYQRGELKHKYKTYNKSKEEE